MASPACHPCYPGSPSIGSGSYCQDRCSGLPQCRRGSTTPLCISRLHLGSLALRSAGLLDSLKEPLSGNLMLQVTPYTSLQLRGRATELPRSDFNRQVTRFTRHTLLLLNSRHSLKLRITDRKRVTAQGLGFALVVPIVRFTVPARIIVSGQIMSSFLKRRNSNVPRIRT
jgi:hypothetical protein